MERALTYITLDVQKIDSGQQITAKRGDSARRLVVSLTNRGRPYIPGEGVTAVFYARKPDGNPCFNAADIDGCTVIYDFTGQTTNVEGLITCEIRLYDAENHLLTSPRFELLVDGTEYQEGDVPDSSPEFTALTQMIGEGTAIIGELREALTGLDNVEEVLTQAEAEATAAARSEEAARGAAAAAQSASGIAAAQANASKNAAEEAGEHQNAASLSAANAQASAQAAQKQAQQAAASATTAGNAAAAAQELAARAEAAAERAENAQGSSVSGGSVELDTTLTKSGKAADSKAVGDEIKRVEGLIPSIEGLAKAEDIPDVPSWALAADKPSYTKSEVGLGNVDNVRQYSASNPPPYPVESVNGQTGAVVLGAPDVGAEPVGAAAGAASAHNSSNAAHSDIRLLIEGLANRLNALANSTDTDLDQLAEIVAYIKSNKSLIDAITTSKVSVSDIVNDLTTNVANRPLSAAQGVVLKALFDKIPEWALAASKPGYTKSEVGLSNVDNVRQYSVSNPPPYPVTSVNGQTGAVVVDVPTMVSQLTNDSKFISAITDAMITAALGYTPINPGKATLGRHEDGLLYLFVDGKPVGSGVELPTGGIDGYITEDKQIIFNNLPDGEYTLAYLMEDGSVVTIGELVKDTNTYYSVTSNLTNCTSSNAETQVAEGGSYSAVITANAGYELESVTVTMGGVDISSTAVSGGKITIANVTGNIVINAVAEEIVANYTNLFAPVSTQINKRLNSSKAVVSADGYIVTNFIDVSDKVPFTANTKIYIKGAGFTNGGDTSIRTFTTNGTLYTDSYSVVNGSSASITDEGNGVISVTNLSASFTANVVRLCLSLKVEDTAITTADIANIVITIDEPITDGAVAPAYTNLLPLATDTDGSLFVGPNGEAGYKPNTRVRISNGEEQTATGIEATGFIPVKYKQTLYIKGITIAGSTDETTEGLCFYNSSREFICGSTMAYAFGNTSGEVASCMVYDTLVNGITADADIAYADIAYARMSATEIGPDSIVTVNEPLE